MSRQGLQIPAQLHPCGGALLVLNVEVETGCRGACRLLRGRGLQSPGWPGKPPAFAREVPSSLILPPCLMDPSRVLGGWGQGHLCQGLQDAEPRILEVPGDSSLEAHESRVAPHRVRCDDSGTFPRWGSDRHNSHPAILAICSPSRAEERDGHTIPEGRVGWCANTRSIPLTLSFIL